MSSKYNYLQKYIENKQSKGSYNYFQAISTKEIIAEEQRLGFSFPTALKEFWLEIGCGFLQSTPNNVGKATIDHNNRIMDPTSIADIILLKEESGLILPWMLEYYEEGYLTDEDIPFFEIQTSDFLFMKLKSSKPSAVYNIIGEIIEEEFERFIWRLYHESPTYYLEEMKKVSTTKSQ